MSGPYRGRTNRAFVAIAIVVCILSIYGSYVVPLRAASGWSTPRLVFEATGRLGGQDLVVDAYGRAHAVWVAQENFGLGDIPSTLYYQRLDLTDSEPLALKVLNSAQSAPSVAVGADDTVFVNTLGNLAVQAPARDALSLRSWKAASGDVDALLYGQVVADRSGDIWIAYADRSGGSVLLQRWRMETSAWDAPVEVARTETNNTAAEYVRVAFGPDGVIHVIWGEFQLPSAWPPTGVYYARSNDQGKTWGRILEVARGPYDQPNIAIGPSNNVVLVWNGMIGVGGRYMRSSGDGGETWSATTTFVPLRKGGTEGPPGVAIDSRGWIHVLTSYDNCAWYLTLANGVWSTPVCISDAPNVPRGHLELPSMTIGQGNRLHAMFYADDTKLFYTTLNIDAPGTAVLPQPTPNPPNPTATAGAPPRAGLTITPPPALDPTLPISLTNQTEFVAAGALAPLALIALVALFVGLRTRS